MVRRENNLTTYPTVDAAFEAIANWVTIYRNVTGVPDERNPCSPNEVMRMAEDIGVTEPTQRTYQRTQQRKPLGAHVTCAAC
jgi:hypothetical protein